MQQNFVKFLQGHEIEFVRLMYPLRYKVCLRRDNQNPIPLLATKGDDGSWNIVDEHNEAPEWINDIAFEINETILLNESLPFEEVTTLQK